MSDLLPFAPVRLCCGKRHRGVVCPDGLVPCCLCFGRFPLEMLSKDDDGNLLDICLECDDQ